MNKLKPSTAIILETRRGRQDGSYPIKLRITYNRERRYYGTGKHLFNYEWEKIVQRKAKGELKDLQTELNNIEVKSEKVLKSFDQNDEEFSFVRFEEMFFGSNNYTSDIFIAFEEQIRLYKINGQISNASTYECAKNSLIEFTKKESLKFKEVSTEFLDTYQKWMIYTKENSVSTLGIYLRNLRALFNIAIGKGVITQEQYPFGKRKYIIPTSDSADKGLSKEIIQKIYNYKCDEHSNEDRAKDLWFFSYLCNGMNIKDICRLRYRNIDQEKIIFKRAKTERTCKKERYISILLNDEIQKIIKKWGNEMVTANTYVFPFFYEGLSAQDERRITQNITGVINDWMGKIMRKLELPIKVTTYSARHSHSNILKEGGAPIKLIADNLGHSSIQTTERHYLSQFDKETKKEFNNKLTFYLENI